MIRGGGQLVEVMAGPGVSEPGSERTCACVSVWVWVNPVPGFTAAQGHHLQPHHWSAGDGFIPNQQKVSVSGNGGGGGRPEQRESVRLCHRPPTPFRRSSSRYFSLSLPVNSFPPHLQSFLFVPPTTWWIDDQVTCIFNSTIQVLQSPFL